jgi:hypothetical protein
VASGAAISYNKRWVPRSIPQVPVVPVQSTRRSRSFSLRTLLLVVTFLGIALGLWHHFGEPRLRRQALIGNIDQRFELKFEQRFTHSDGKHYRVLVFDSWFKIWPGDNPYLIVVASDDYRLVTAGQFGGSEHLESVSLSSDHGKTILSATCLHRPMLGGVGTYRYEISPTQVTPYGNVQWDDPEYWDRFAAALERHANQSATRK